MAGAAASAASVTPSLSWSSTASSPDASTSSRLSASERARVSKSASRLRERFAFVAGDGAGHRPQTLTAAQPSPGTGTASVDKPSSSLSKAALSPEVSEPTSAAAAAAVEEYAIDEGALNIADTDSAFGVAPSTASALALSSRADSPQLVPDTPTSAAAGETRQEFFKFQLAPRRPLSLRHCLLRLDPPNPPAVPVLVTAVSPNKPPEIEGFNLVPSFEWLTGRSETSSTVTVPEMDAALTRRTATRDKGKAPLNEVVERSPSPVVVLEEPCRKKESRLARKFSRDPAEVQSSDLFFLVYVITLEQFPLA
ncbi:hypothetical protein DFJ73DRAFT_756816 [Zopfochytrium polystomum]|nr:hypothetical protein DFJ73DRAFT_756816 [Zopfochytrium polystomum]